MNSYTLVMLCHRFARRARAMVRSLAQQVSPPAMHLAVFYARPADRETMEEGMIGSEPPILWIRLADDQAMKRAQAFHRFTASTTHIVYTDVDLWYPPTFWHDYDRAVVAAAPGYWSAYVRDVPYAAAEPLVAAWSSLNEALVWAQSADHQFPVRDPRTRKIIAPLTRWRYEKDKGQVGHFQCVPAGLLAYPADDRPAVDKADQVFSNAAVALSQDHAAERRLGVVHAYHLSHPKCWTGTYLEL